MYRRTMYTLFVPSYLHVVVVWEVLVLGLQYRRGWIENIKREPLKEVEFFLTVNPLLYLYLRTYTKVPRRAVPLPENIRLVEWRNEKKVKFMRYDYVLWACNAFSFLFSTSTQSIIHFYWTCFSVFFWLVECKTVSCKVVKDDKKGTENVENRLLKWDNMSSKHIT